MGLDLTAYLEYPLNRPAEERSLVEVDTDLDRNRRIFALMGAPGDPPTGTEKIGVRGIPPDFHNPIHDDDPYGPAYPQWDEREDVTSWLTTQDMREVAAIAESLDANSYSIRRIIEEIERLETQGIACRVFCDWSI